MVRLRDPFVLTNEALNLSVFLADCVVNEKGRRDTAGGDNSKCHWSGLGLSGCLT